MKTMCVPLVLAGCFPSIPAFADSKATGPRGNPAMFFGPEAYPAEALRLEQQGRVVATLVISASGKVASCNVTVSSGSPSLDSQTCAIALEKIVFDPAKDRRGNAIATTYILPVRWVLPNGPIEVGSERPLNWTIDLTVSVDAGGIVTACNGTVTPANTFSEGPCDEFPVGSQSDFRWLRHGKPVGGVVRRRSSEETMIDP